MNTEKIIKAYKRKFCPKDIWDTTLVMHESVEWLTKTLKKYEQEVIVCSKKGIHTCKLNAIHIPERFCGDIKKLK